MLDSNLLIKPTKEIWWMEMSVGPSFIRKIGNNELEIFITGRDKLGVSRIGRGIIGIQNNTLKVEEIFDNPILDIGPSGCFDENGVSYPWIIKHNNIEYMYYVGWVEGGKNRFQNFLGVATKSCEQSFFKREFNIPILDRTEEEPFGTGSCCVVRKKDEWVMLYTSFLPWKGELKANNFHPFSQPSYNIKTAFSKDLLNWKRTNNSLLNFKANEYIHGKPVIFGEDEKNIELYFSVRGEAYRIG